MRNPIKPSPRPGVKKLARPEPRFPAATPWLLDELIPTYVKKNYSPRESWKDKPFTKDDLRFFYKGLEELSELFTEERRARMPAYFNHSKFRSAYLLYFLPLQLAKFITAFELHPGGIDAALEHGRKQGVMRVADLGAGPGTASLALLLTLLAFPAEEIPPVELIWLDTNRAIMQDGEQLALSLAEQFPKLRGKIKIKTIVAPWWNAGENLRQGPPMSLLLMGHVLNEDSRIPRSKAARANRVRDVYEELHEPPRGEPEVESGEFEEEAPGPESGSTTGNQEHAPEELAPAWRRIFELDPAGGILMIEPAAKETSQHLSRLRNIVVAVKATEGDGHPVSSRNFWGPCPHAEACPLALGRDYCHFSVPTKVPGSWFREFSKALSSERSWLKFSYVWYASEAYPAPKWNPRYRLVISDPLATKKTSSPRTLVHGPGTEVLICVPDKPDRIAIGGAGSLWRGDVIEIASKPQP